MVEKEVNLKKINIETLVPADYNPRIISDTDYNNLKNSIDEFGIVSPIIVNLKDNTIISGHQRFDVLYYEHNVHDLFLLELGDIGWVFTETELEIKDKNYEKTLNLALNRIHGEFDPDKLDVVLSDLQEVKLDSLTGFDLKLDDISYDFVSRMEDDYYDDELIEEEYDDYEDDFDEELIEDEIIEDEVIEETIEEPKQDESIKQETKERIRRGFIKYGDVYKIGESYLMFGKADNEQDRTRLLNTPLPKTPDNLSTKLTNIKKITKEINYYMSDDAELIENIIIKNKKICKKIK